MALFVFFSFIYLLNSPTIFLLATEIVQKPLNVLRKHIYFGCLTRACLLELKATNILN